MTDNYALPGNPNATMTRLAAIHYLVDCCLNVEEYEWASASVRLKDQAEAINDIAEVADKARIKVDDLMLVKAYDLIEGSLLW